MRILGSFSSVRDLCSDPAYLLIHLTACRSIARPSCPAIGGGGVAGRTSKQCWRIDTVGPGVVLCAHELCFFFLRPHAEACFPLVRLLRGISPVKTLKTKSFVLFLVFVPPAPTIISLSSRGAKVF